MENNKKKLIVIAVLGVAMIAVGAFQFLGEEPAPVVKKKNKSARSSSATQSDIAANGGDTTSRINDIVAANQLSEDNPALLAITGQLSQRDPFAQGGAKLEPADDGTQPTAPTTTQKQPEKVWLPGDRKGPSFPTGGGFDPNTIPPFPVPGPGGKTDIQATGPPPDAFTMTPIGVIMGSRPAVVFLDQSGNQMLVPLGGSINNDSKVTGIEKNKVRVKHLGKELTFTVGGTPNEP